MEEGLDIVAPVLYAAVRAACAALDPGSTAHLHQHQEEGSDALLLLLLLLRRCWESPALE